MPLAVGTRLGPDEILSALGAGGMGEVYRALVSGARGNRVALRRCRSMDLPRPGKHPHEAITRGSTANRALPSSP